MKYHLLLLMLLLLGCKNKDREIEYFSNGKIKTEAEVRNGVRDGLLTEYYDNGTVKSRQFWEHGVMEGQFIDYFPSGKLKRKGLLQDGKMVEMTIYYETGSIQEEQHYDSLGNIYRAERYLENGIRDSIPYPFFYIPYSDTLKVGKEAILRCQALNIIDSVFVNDVLIITTAFDSLSTKQVLPKDTVELIQPQGNTYEYKFRPDKIGMQFIYGEVIFKKDEGKEWLIISHKVRYPYFVVE